MKKTIVLLWALFALRVVFGQVWADRYYGFPNTEEHFTNIYAAKVGGYLLGGSYGNTNGKGDDIWLIKIDSTGHEIWSKQYGTEHNDHLSEIATSTDGGYFLAGSNHVGYNQSTPYIIKLKKDFEVIWEVNLPGSSENDVVKDIEPLQGGGALVITNDEPAQVNNSKLYKLDSLGNIEWVLNKTQTNIYDGRCILTNNEGQFFYGGHKNGTGAIKIIDNDGNLLATKVYYDILHTGKMSVLIVRQTIETGGYLIYGISQSNEKILTKVNDQLDVEWQAHFEMPDATHSIFELEQNKFLLIGHYGLLEANYSNNTLATNYKSFNYDPDIDYVYDAVINQKAQLALAGLHRNPYNGEDAIAIVVEPDLGEIWNQVYGQPGYPNNESAGALVKSSDGGYFLGGTAHFTQTNSDFYLIRTDPAGEIEWEGNYGGAGTQATVDIAPTGDGGVLLISFESAPNNRNLVLAKVDSTGIQQWQKSFGAYASLINTCQVVNLPDDNSLIYYSGRKENDDTWAKVMKIGPAGDSIWVKELHFDNIHNRFFNAKLCTDGNVIAIGRSMPYLDGWIVKTDTAGNEIFNLSLDFPGLSQDLLFGLTEASNGDYLVTGGLKSGISVYDSFLVTRISSLGDVIWHKIFRISGADHYRQIIEKTSNGEFLIALSSASDLHNFFVLRIDGDGNLLELIENYRQWGDFFKDSQITANDQLALISDGLNKNTEDIQLIITLPGGALKTVEIKPLGHLHLSPNPSPSSLKISFESDLAGEMGIEIFNTSGQCVHYLEEKKEGSFFEKSYHLAALPAGTYFVRVSVGGRSISRAWAKQ